ncbi:MAG: hypothetical protein ACLTDF_00065 [Coprococcus sp.]
MVLASILVLLTWLLKLIKASVLVVLLTWLLELIKASVLVVLLFWPAWLTWLLNWLNPPYWLFCCSGWPG